MFIDTSIPSPAALAYLLRHPELDPKDFEFNYYDCNRCGMGRANRAWGTERFEDNAQAAKWTADKLGISQEESNRIFCLRTPYDGGVSREAIAKDLEALVTA